MHVLRDDVGMFLTIMAMSVTQSTQRTPVCVVIHNVAFALSTSSLHSGACDALRHSDTDSAKPVHRIVFYMQARFSYDVGRFIRGIQPGGQRS